jgi:acyl-CoA dehydrogenase
VARTLLDGDIRSAFAMTEPAVASSDARNITTSIVRDGDDYVINGRKWWTSGAADERCAIFVVMGRTATEGPGHRQQSMVLVPRETPGLTIERHLPLFGYQDQHGHSEIVFDDVRVPVGNRLAGEGDGFMIAQARLGPGRIHHAMRAIGMAERALVVMSGEVVPVVVCELVLFCRQVKASGCEVELSRNRFINRRPSCPTLTPR